ncbi:MAG TPA: HTTM domain-containing protein [Polyangiaceae bacterium]|nr:HTTM domain-containing protein [Polyangiaceae bacterium]
MKRLATWWVELTSARERATTLACFRIAVALVIAGSLISVASAGLVEVLWIDAAHGGMRPLPPGFWPLQLLGGSTPRAVWTLFGVALGSSTLMALGLGGRWPVLVALYAYRAVSTAGAGSGGYDAVIFNAAWLLFLSESTATLSLDCRLRNGAWTSERLVPAWPRYLVIFQLVVIYTFTGFQKTSASWNPADGYSALYWFLQDPNWIRFDSSWTVTFYPLTQLMTAIVFHFETSAPLLLLVYYYRSTRDRPGRLRAIFNRFDLRIPFTVVGLGMHIGILVLMNMGPFSWISMAYYLCLWRPEEIERWLRLPQPAVHAEAPVGEGA